MIKAISLLALASLLLSSCGEPKCDDLKSAQDDQWMKCMDYHMKRIDQ